MFKGPETKLDFSYYIGVTAKSLCIGFTFIYPFLVFADEVTPRVQDLTWFSHHTSTVAPQWLAPTGFQPFNKPGKVMTGSARPSIIKTAQLAPLNRFPSNSGDQFGLTIVSQNLNRFFDDRDDGNNEKIVTSKIYHARLQQLLGKIKKTYRFADVLAFQEVENINILNDICGLIRDNYHIEYHPVLIEGNDQSGIDVGFLVRDTYQVTHFSSIYRNKRYGGRHEKLFSRPPLIIEICNKGCFTIMNLHLRSMRGIRNPKTSNRVVMKRRLQAESIARWVDQFQRRHPEHHLIISGDFNALRPSDHYVDSVGIIEGNPDPIRPKWKSPDLVSRDLVDLSQTVSSELRFSYRYKGKNQLIDYILVSSNLKKNPVSVHFTEIDYSFSDHAALMAHINQ